MILDTYTFPVNPNKIDPFEPEISNAEVETYSSVGYFSWGPRLIGKTIIFEWSYMTVEMFLELDELYQADAQIVFDPEDDTGKTYDVNIKKLIGPYLYSMASTSALRKDVKMELLIMTVNEPA